MQKISPFLWFDNQAEEAMNFYVSVFKNSAVVAVQRYPEGSPGQAGSVMTCSFTLDGQQFTALNGGPMYKFSEAISFVVDCADQAEVDEYWGKLTADGGQLGQCGWLKDKFGVSWQVVPAGLYALLSDPNPEKAKRATQAMLQMSKIDLAAIQAAANQAPPATDLHPPLTPTPVNLTAPQPIATSPASAAAPTELPASTGDGFKIVIVEDNVALSDIYKTRLDAQGYHCEVAYDGREALQLIEKAQPDLVLLDLMVPKVAGDQILSTMRANEWGKQTKVLIISNLNEADAPPGLRDFNISGYVVKANLSNDDLDRLVDNILKPVAQTSDVSALEGPAQP
jgi:predicted 3-demethylubiquinone-9 3-methyltransferase (glyoxalase superfamily)/CheY-like chemotaxis protein